MKLEYERHVQGRMFKSDWMEAISKVHPSMPFIVYAPLVAWLLGTALFRLHTTLLATVALTLAGGLIWVLLEYVIHRYLFHWEGNGPITRRFHDVIHGFHHKYPDDAVRLVMPLSASLPLALTIGGLMWLFRAPQVTHPIFAGIVIGYLYYDFMHWFVHRGNPKSAWGKAARAHHMAHHFAVNDANFGISNRWIDEVMRSSKKHRTASQSAARVQRPDGRDSSGPMSPPVAP